MPEAFFWVCTTTRLSLPKKVSPLVINTLAPANFARFRRNARSGLAAPMYTDFQPLFSLTARVFKPSLCPKTVALVIDQEGFVRKEGATLLSPAVRA